MSFPIPNADPTSLQGAGLNKPFVLSNIVKLVTNMTKVLQKAAAAQAGGLTVLADMQRAYTDLMAKVPSGPTDADVWGTDTSTVGTEKRSNLLRAFANMTSTLQNRQSIISDTAKALQSAVNQSNDAVNQQANVGTTMLQEIQTLLGSIYR